MARRIAGLRCGGRSIVPAVIALAMLPSPGLAQETTSPGPARETTSPAAENAEGDEGRGGAWFPSRSAFWDLLAPPRANGMWASLIGFELEEGLYSGERTLAADVQLGYLIVVRRFQTEADSRPALDLGVDFILTPRFNLDEPQKDLINTDFRLGVPFSVAYKQLQARFGYVHESSHLGDETILRFTLGTLEQSSRDAIELTLAYEVAELGRLYVGGGWNWNHSESNEDVIGWGGLEFDPGRSRPSLVIWPYAGADFRITDLTGRFAGTIVGGAGWRVAERILRIELRGHFGPSPMGQFRNIDEKYFGVALRFDPFPPQ